MNSPHYYYELTSPRELQRRELVLEGPLAADAIEARTRFSLISPGTELAAWAGKAPLRPSRVYPRLQGYCNVAEVTAVGAGVDSLGKGDWVLTHQSHRSAFRCPARDVLLKLEAADDAMRAALSSTYLFHLGYAALQAAGFRPGHEVAVIGHGALGYATTSLVQAFGGWPVVFTGRPESVAVRAGRDIRGKNAPSASYWQARAGIDGADVVVNTADGWAEHRLSLEIARKNGVVVLLGFPGRNSPPPQDNPLDSRYVYDKQLTLRHAGQVPELDVAASDIRFTLKRNLVYLARLLADRHLDASPFLQLRLPAAELARAYGVLENRETSSLSALLEW